MIIDQCHAYKPANTVIFDDFIVGVILVRFVIVLVVCRAVFCAFVAIDQSPATVQCPLVKTARLPVLFKSRISLAAIGDRYQTT